MVSRSSQDARDPYCGDPRVAYSVQVISRAPISRELAQLFADSIKASLDRAESYPRLTDRPSGVFGRDLVAIAAAPADVREVREKLHATMLDGVKMFLAHAIDHIRSLANDMLRDPMPVRSPLTLCRGVQESTVWMCHLLDPAISTDVRLCRTAALWLDDSQPARAAALTFGAEQGAGVDDYHAFKLTVLEAAGFAIDCGTGRHPVRVRLGDAVAPLRLNLTEEVTRLMPVGAPSPYRLGSGAAHGRPWMLERSATRAADGNFVGEGSTSAMAALTVILCMKAWVTA